MTLVSVGPVAADRRSPRRTPWRRCWRDRRRDRGRATSSSQRSRVEHRAGRIGRRSAAAIGAVGIGGEYRDTVESLQQAGQRQRVLLVRAAAAVAAHGDGEFAAGEDRQLRLPSRAPRASLRMRGRDLARLAFEFGAEIDDLEARIPRDGDRGVERRLAAARSAKTAHAQSAGSPGLQLSFAGSSQRPLHGVVGRDRKTRTTARASASVVGSATVGPEAMTAGSSFGTSEIASVTIAAGCRRARAVRP